MAEKIAITGGTGFVGRNLARVLAREGHETVLIARGQNQTDASVRDIPGAKLCPIGTDNEDKLAAAFAGCTAVAHCAGINREVGAQTYQAVHVAGTQNVVNAARRAGVKKIVLMSFLRARPDCGSGYHESKWQAEEIVRHSGLDYTIIKAGVIYGAGDHMLDHLSHAFHTFPVFGFVGLKDQPVRPVAVEDLARILSAALTQGRLTRQTVAVMGPEEIPLRTAVRRVAKAVGKHPLMIPLPLWFHYIFAWAIEKTMVVPMVSTAQVRMLSEGIAVAATPCDELPADLQPTLPFSDEQIRRGLPPAKGFGFADLRLCRRLHPSAS